VVSLHRAVAVAEVHGPGTALELLGELELELERYYLFHAVRADLLRRLGREHEAALAYGAAIARVENTVERRFLERRLAELEGAAQARS
jgi:RNA polymerase sigma-70 factor (ECF subfamily)